VKNDLTVVVQEKMVAVLTVAAVAENVAHTVEIAKVENVNLMVETEKVENVNLTAVAKVALMLEEENVVLLMVATKKEENVSHLTVKVEMEAENVVHLTSQQEKDLLAEIAKEQNVEDVLLNNNNFPQITQILQIKFSEICEISGVK
jgi:hypothetical protein